MFAPSRPRVGFLTHLPGSADQEAGKISGMAVQWQDDYSHPKPDQVIKQSSVWLLYYPASVITKEGTSIIGTWADPQLWTAAHTIGIELLHTDPVEDGRIFAGGQAGADGGERSVDHVRLGVDHVDSHLKMSQTQGFGRACPQICA